MVLRAAVIGMGSMGQNHARVLEDLQGVKLVAAVDARFDNAGGHGGALSLNSVTELEELDIDLAVVATPTSTHCEVTLELIAQGSSVLVEKPLALNLEDAGKMFDAISQTEQIGMVGHIERFNPAVIALKAFLGEGRLGSIYQIATRRQGRFPERIVDTGVVMDLTTHDIDLVRFLSGANYEKILGCSWQLEGKKHEDLVAATGYLENGVVVNHLTNWLSQEKNRTVEVVGELGSATANTVTGELTVSTKDQEFADFLPLTTRSFGPELVPNVDRHHEPLRLELEAFRDAVASRGESPISFVDGMEVVRVAVSLLAGMERPSKAQFPVSI